MIVKKLNYIMHEKTKMKCIKTNTNVLLNSNIYTTVIFNIDFSTDVS